MFIYIYIYASLSLSLYIYIYMYMYICIDVYMYACIYVCVYVCMYVCVYIYIYTYIYIYICIYARGCFAPSSEPRMTKSVIDVHRQGRNIARQKSTRQKYSRTFSGIVQWMLSGIFRYNFNVQWYFQKDYHFSSGLPLEQFNGLSAALSHGISLL